MRDGQLLHTFKGHRASVLDAAFSPRGAKVATASADGTGRIWDVRTGILLATVVGHKGIVDAVAFSPDGNFVVTGSADRHGTDIERPTTATGGRSSPGHGDSVNSVAFSRDGTTRADGERRRHGAAMGPAIQPQPRGRPYRRGARSQKPSTRWRESG